jgi:O-antigen ligase
LLAILFSQSRNAVLGVSAGLATAMSLGVRRGFVFAIAAATASLVLFAVALHLGNLPERLTSLDWSREGRIGLYLTAWQMFLDAPLFGLGNFTFGIHYPSYLERISLPGGYVPELRYIPWAHNLYLEALAERGLFGLLSFLALIASLASRVARGLCAAQSVELRAVRLALITSLVILLAMGLFDLTFLKDWVSFLFLLIAGLIAGPVGSLSPSANPKYSG